MRKVQYVSAALALVDKHMKYFPSLWKNLELVNPGFDEVVVVCSGLSRRSLVKVKDILDASALNASTVVVPLMPLGVNRNLGWLASKGEIVCFLDADDLYHTSYRLKVQELFDSFDADIVLHSFVELNNRMAYVHKNFEWQAMPENANFKPLNSHDLMECNDLFDSRDRVSELRSSARSSQLRLPPNWGANVHQGHASVRRSLISSANYILEIGQRNEDGIFIRDCLESGMKVIVSPERLTAYSLHTSALYFSWRGWVRRAVRLILRVTTSKAAPGQ